MNVPSEPKLLSTQVGLPSLTTPGHNLTPAELDALADSILPSWEAEPESAVSVRSSKKPLMRRAPPGIGDRAESAPPHKPPARARVSDPDELVIVEASIPSMRAGPDVLASPYDAVIPKAPRAPQEAYDTLDLGKHRDVMDTVEMYSGLGRKRFLGIVALCAGLGLLVGGVVAYQYLPSSQATADPATSRAPAVAKESRANGATPSTTVASVSPPPAVPVLTASALPAAKDTAPAPEPPAAPASAAKPAPKPPAPPPGTAAATTAAPPKPAPAQPRAPGTIVRELPF